MRLDIHVHTSPGSRCSVMTLSQYLDAIREAGVRAACITNHGNMSDYDELVRLAPAGLEIIPGVEISTTEGDFLIFTPELDYLRTLEAVQPLPEPRERPEECAVVWAHPFAGSQGGRGVERGYLAHVAARVDGIEVYNGNWPDEEASRLAAELAAEFDLAELGGSDTHRLQQFFRCWSEVGGFDEGSGMEGLVRAIREGRTEAFTV